MPDCAFCKGFQRINYWVLLLPLIVSKVEFYLFGLNDRIPEVEDPWVQTRDFVWLFLCQVGQF